MARKKKIVDKPELEIDLIPVLGDCMILMRYGNETYSMNTNLQNFRRFMIKGVEYITYADEINKQWFQYDN